MIFKSDNWGGDVTMALSKNASVLVYGDITGSSQISAIISDQSSEIPNLKYLEQKFEKKQKELEGKKIIRPNYWGGIIIKPLEIEFWQGRPSRLHNRVFFKINKNSKWEAKLLSP